MSSDPRNVNLQSVDAMFATLLNETMQIKTMVREYRDLAERTDRRVVALEQDAAALKSRIGGAVAVVSLLVGVIGFAVQTGLHKIFIAK